MDIRPYQPQDVDACLRLFDSNLPQHFAVHERPQFEAFLRSPLGGYFVMEKDGELLGCGGFALESEPGLVSLTWGMVRQDLHRNGLGRFLLFYRLKEIGKLPGISMVRLKTMPHLVPFFEKAGTFRVVGEEGELVTMVKKLAVCT